MKITKEDCKSAFKISKDNDEFVLFSATCSCGNKFEIGNAQELIIGGLTCSCGNVLLDEKTN